MTTLENRIDRLFSSMLNEIHRLQHQNASLQQELKRLQTERDTPTPPPSIEYKMDTVPPPLPPILYLPTPTPEPEPEPEVCPICYESTELDVTCGVCSNSICLGCQSQLNPNTRCPMCRSHALPISRQPFFDPMLQYRIRESLPTEFSEMRDMIPTANALAQAFGRESWQDDDVFMDVALVIRDKLFLSNRKTVRFYYRHTLEGDHLTTLQRLPPSYPRSDYQSFQIRLRR